MKEIILDSLIFMIPLWSSLGFLAFKRPMKFKHIYKYFIAICLIFSVICIIWNVSGIYFSKLLYKEKIDYKIISNIEDIHYIEFYYSLILPYVTMFFVLFLKYVSDTDSENPNEPKNKLN